MHSQINEGQLHFAFAFSPCHLMWMSFFISLSLSIRIPSFVFCNIRTHAHIAHLQLLFTFPPFVARHCERGPINNNPNCGQSDPSMSVLVPLSRSPSSSVATRSVDTSLHIRIPRTRVIKGTHTT